jgi:hypothetical protein
MTMTPVANFSRVERTAPNIRSYTAQRSAGSIIDLLLTDLRSVLADLGKDGGFFSPSVYDTAQLLRLYPPVEGVDAALEWLLTQQQADGGWGDRALPLMRDVPTLAAVLTLHSYQNFKGTRAALQAGLNFLQGQADYWRELQLDNVPAAAELTIPYLLEEAAAVNLEVPQQHYTEIVKLGNQRRQRLARLNNRTGGNALACSWEVWGKEPYPSLIDGSGGVGHSPATTAAWLQAAAGRSDLMDTRVAAESYLARAAAATGLNIPGVVPTQWPLERFEQAFSLYSLLITGLLEHPALQDLVQPHLHELASMLIPNGIGASAFFIPDGDDTAAAVSVLYGAGWKVDLAGLRQFENDDGYFTTFPGELHPSISVTARAVHALAIAGEKVAQPIELLLERQSPDGRWTGDKWHSSWLYVTLHVALALLQSGHYSLLKSTIKTLLAHQHTDGGWGTGYQSTTLETAYAVLTLQALKSHGLLDERGLEVQLRGYHWLVRNYSPFQWNEERQWIAKDLYGAYRIDRAFELSAMLAMALTLEE